MPATQEDLFVQLNALGIETRTVAHPPFMTVDEAKAGRETHDLPGGHCKTLFLKNKKGDLILVVALEDARLNIKALGKALGAGRLSFCSAERLMEHLGVTPGSVTPFALINDDKQTVRVVLDGPMLDQEILNFHPLQNTATTAISPQDLLHFITAGGHRPEIVDFAALE